MSAVKGSLCSRRTADSCSSSRTLPPSAALAGAVTREFDLAVLVSLHPTVHVQINLAQEAVGLSRAANLHLFGASLEEEHLHALADEFHRSLEQAPLHHHGAVLVHPAPYRLSEVVPEIVGRRTQALHPGGEPLERGLSRGTGGLGSNGT